MNRDTVIFLVIYIVAFAMVLQYNLTHMLVNDGVKEYQAYLLNIEEGWEFRRTLVNSCLVTTWLPALIQQWIGFDSLVLFRVFPTFFYPLMPAFTYLIAKRYLVTKYAIVAVIVVLFNSHFLFFPDIGRVGVAIGFMAGIIWALLEKRLVWAIIFAVLIVFSHYGTSLICIGIVGVSLLIYGVWKHQLLKQYLVVFCLLFMLMGVWNFVLSSYSGFVMLTYGLQHSLPEHTGDTSSPVYGLDTDAWLDLETREPAVQDAVGLNIGTMSTPKMIEVVANWLVVIIITLGLYCVVRDKTIDNPFKIMSLALWSLILFTITVPWLSVFYGGMRVYFSVLMVLAICFPLGAEKIARKIHIPPLVLSTMVLSLYALSTSGIIYMLFGLTKTFPAYIWLE